MTLSKLKVGQSAVVKKISAESNMKIRLEEIGFFEGAKVNCITKSPLGDPTAFRVRGALIALRNKDADTIECESIK